MRMYNSCCCKRLKILIKIEFTVRIETAAKAKLIPLECSNTLPDTLQANGNFSRVRSQFFSQATNTLEASNKSKENKIAQKIPSLPPTSFTQQQTQKPLPFPLRYTY